MTDAHHPGKHSRQSIRLKGFDYSQPGSYFITIVTNNRECLFGTVVGGEVCLNEFGRLVSDEWQKSAIIRTEIVLDIFVIMPNHIHGVVTIVHDRAGATGRSPLQSGPAQRSIVGGFKAAVTKQINTLRRLPEKPIWQRNYYEHVIRNEESLGRIRQYITEIRCDGSLIRKIQRQQDQNAVTHFFCRGDRLVAP